ncbi:MAG: hypothetical protein ACTSRW_15935 [Candidatus Helarchaeota archaeon]
MRVGAIVAIIIGGIAIIPFSLGSLFLMASPVENTLPRLFIGLKFESSFPKFW